MPIVYFCSDFDSHYSLQTSVDITKTQGVQLPSQFEFRYVVYSNALFWVYFAFTSSFFVLLSAKSVWVHNQAGKINEQNMLYMEVISLWSVTVPGPDCTLMSKVFRVASSEHTNEASFAMSQLDDNIDRGCFGIAMDKPELGRHADPSKVLVQISTSPPNNCAIFGITWWWWWRRINLFQW